MSLSFSVSQSFYFSLSLLTLLFPLSLSSSFFQFNSCKVDLATRLVCLINRSECVRCNALLNICFKIAQSTNNSLNKNNSSFSSSSLPLSFSLWPFSLILFLSLALTLFYASIKKNIFRIKQIKTDYAMPL